MKNLEIRESTTSDIKAIHRLVESVYRGENSRRGWTTEADLLDGQRTDEELLSQMQAQENSNFLLAFSGNKLLGCVFLENRDSYAYLGMLSVDVSAQNMKLGRHLLESSEQWIKEKWGLNEVRIRVIDVRHELIEWYKRRAYSLTNDFSNFPDDPRFGIAKVKNLRFVEMRKIIR